ncbi:MAG: DNA repair protein RadC [Pseudomonas sp.]|uniref:RadC family protein n=1 Tax=Halopseudomonas sp. TaxID=2901191 RepID=UPI001A5E4633|nr:DNA repair protein RadC [Pseudomonas sp.]|tara:strand:+ start:3390 stop:3878 length:489 start_codon:yes stop_codon:yes gene_type:complete
MSDTQIHETFVQTAPASPSEDQVLIWAQAILEARFTRSNFLTSPVMVRDYLRLAFASEEREVFGIILLDNQHGVLGFERLFYGTIDSASVYPREVIKTVLNANAAAVILTHNHPSGNPEPSQADIRLTSRIRVALETIDVRLLDHLVIGGTTSVSLAERGLL